MDAEMKAAKLREDDRMLQVIDACISSRDHDYERNKAILTEILEDVFTTMKGRDGFFRDQFQSFFFIENYYRGPKVGESEEFYVNISIKLPLNCNLIKFQEGEPGYKKLVLCNLLSIYTPQWHKYSNFTSKWLEYRDRDDEWNTYDMNEDAFRQSMESMLAWAMLNIPRIDNYTIKVCDDGSAFTLCVKQQDSPEMKVNLMPVLELDCEPPYPVEGFKWYAVPDPLKDAKDQHLQWRMVFYNHENDLLTRHNYLTPVIRKLEKLRDAQEWTVISYYHIKALAMHYARSMENDVGLPNTFKLSGIKLLIHMLDRLRNMCKTQYLSNVWIPEHNLIDTDKSQFADIAEQLTTMINEITDDPTKVAHWILTAEELRLSQNELKAVGILQDTDWPSNSLRMSEDDESGLSEDVRNTADGISKPVTVAIAASPDIESLLSSEGNDKAGCPVEMDMLRVIAGLRNSIKTLSRRVTALEQKTAATV